MNHKTQNKMMNNLINLRFHKKLNNFKINMNENYPFIFKNKFYKNNRKLFNKLH